jgi:hypothetical protein
VLKKRERKKREEKRRVTVFDKYIEINTKD